MHVQAAAAAHFPWLERRTSIPISDKFQAIEAVDDYGIIRGMVGFDGWTWNSCQMHVVLESVGAGRALLRPAFEYVFDETGRGVALGLVRESNLKSLQLARHLGFREVYRIADGWAEGLDMVLLEMRREECRWLKHNQEKAA